MTRQSRREFLENSMFAAVAATAAASPVASQAADREGSKSPNERLRVAVLGVNGRGRSHISGFLPRADCEIAAIVDPDENVGLTKGVKNVFDRTGKKPALYKDMREVFDDKSIDIVSIATPNHWHSLAAIWAVQAGKDVYVEKPISHNVNEGRRVVQAARKHNRMVQAGTQCRTIAGTREAIEFVLAGGIGEVKLARGLCYKPRGSIGPKGNYDVPAGIDYDLWLGPAPKMEVTTRRRFHYDWHWQYDYGNGDLGNQGIHQMDIARWGLGVDTIGDSVIAYGGRLGYVDAGNTANTQVSVHTWGDKTLIFETRGLKTSGLSPQSDVGGSKIGVIFYGTKGYVVQYRYTHSAAFDLDGKMIKEFKGGSDADHYNNFIAGVRSRKHEDLNGEVEKGHISSALCHLGNVSYLLGETVDAKEASRRLDGNDAAMETFDRTVQHLVDNGVDLGKTPLRFGAPVKIDGKAEAATGEMAKAANAMFTREYRAPFVVPEEKAL
ncbi:MAG: dehydrogenase [Planctomycetaceae bacterium]|nr:dehydrogenase [Planctomycetaceae bacterium]